MFCGGVPHELPASRYGRGQILYGLGCGFVEWCQDKEGDRLGL